MGYCGELMVSFELQDADQFSCRMLIIVFAGCWSLYMRDADYLQDADGLITPLEIHIVTSLFLPMDTEAEDQFVEEMIQKMDTNVDGKIDYKEFVQFVRKCGTADVLSTQTSSSSDGVSS